MELLIKNGLVVSPEDGLNARADIYVKGGKIAKIGENLNISVAQDVYKRQPPLCFGFTLICPHNRPLLPKRIAVLLYCLT